MTKDWEALMAETQGSNAWGWQYAQGGQPGYQIAYGVEVETEEPHGYPINQMILMDWSNEHLKGDMYATPPQQKTMPLPDSAQPCFTPHALIQDTGDSWVLMELSFSVTAC